MAHWSPHPHHLSQLGHPSLWVLPLKSMQRTKKGRKHYLKNWDLMYVMPEKRPGLNRHKFLHKKKKKKKKKTDGTDNAMEAKPKTRW